jgi:hypothetical protein
MKRASQLKFNAVASKVLDALEELSASDAADLVVGVLVVHAHQGQHSLETVHEWVDGAWARTSNLRDEFRAEQEEHA